MAAVTEIPQDVALRMQLAAVAGCEPETSYIEIRPLDRDGRPCARARTFVPVRDHATASDRIRSLSPSYNVFIGAAPRVREAGTADAVERIWALWVDLDGRDALERLRYFKPLPAIVIRSGSPDSAHAYWPLKAPVAAAWGQRACRRLALALDGDMCATDPARILRPASSFNWKTSPPAPVTCTRLEFDVFTVDQVVSKLPDSAHYKPRPALSTRVDNRGGDSLAGVLAFVRAGAMGERNRRVNWGAYVLGQRVDVDHEAAREELRRAALETGLDEQEIERTISSGLSAGMRAAA